MERHQRWLRLKVTDGKPNDDVTRPNWLLWIARARTACQQSSGEFSSAASTPPSLLWLEVSALDDSSRKDSPSTDGNQGTPRYEVGYCKPPTTTRFQKGNSGNPRGRPKEAKDKLPAINEERMKSILIEEAYRAIKVRDGSRKLLRSLHFQCQGVAQ